MRMGRKSPAELSGTRFALAAFVITHCRLDRWPSRSSLRIECCTSTKGRRVCHEFCLLPHWQQSGSSALPPRRAADPASTTAPPAAHATTAASSTAANAAKENVRPWRASETIGLEVQNPQGKDLGKIEDIVFNPQTGHIRYAVLSFGGIHSKYFAIPWSHLRSEAKTSKGGSEKFVMVLDVDQNKLKNAPGFDSKNWPDFGNSAYGTSVRQFYGENMTPLIARRTPTRSDLRTFQTVRKGGEAGRLRRAVLITREHQAI